MSALLCAWLLRVDTLLLLLSLLVLKHRRCHLTQIRSDIGRVGTGVPGMLDRHGSVIDQAVATRVMTHHLWLSHLILL